MSYWDKPAKQLESELEADASDYAISRGWFVEKIMRCGRKGFPDRFFARDGVVILVEFKKRDDTSRKQQVVRQRELRAHGVRVEQIDRIEQAHELFR